MHFNLLPEIDQCVNKLVISVYTRLYGCLRDYCKVKGLYIDDIIVQNRDKLLPTADNYDFKRF